MPQIIRKIEQLLKYETAGHPVSGLKWTRKTSQKISAELKKSGIAVCPNTVCRLLKELGYSLRVNCKSVESGVNPPDPQKRDQQFVHIAELREKFARNHKPVISVDTKKKELIGNFKNNGDCWCKQPSAVKDHDFPSDAVGKAVPYGIYDTRYNTGTVFVGKTADTPAFAVDAIETWWKTQGKSKYRDVKELLILADSGGSNSCRSRVWKYRLQKFCDQYDVSVFVSHYPPGSSKWNPIEHRMFSEISKNWAGHPLDSFETVLKYIRTTRTTTGLKIDAHFVRKKYETGERVSDKQMRQLRIEKHESLPEWNYVLSPSKM